ncbi:uncharacterized protein L3040_003832 [Drepanopeziza brunnea f. sp. 'multigermtubi']|uniref:uncharacterized protein n=1 Tax=Drepanopeziza brunnea f. sp. 'multigermtubi' TaxID=698441 RepID=UPI0023A4B71D|nr:hypothetical protein L3040_003832 [Drepanopeziza brunnea f. sp. 'multigermtubi']
MVIIANICLAQATGSDDSLTIMVDASCQQAAPPGTRKTSAATGKPNPQHKTTGKTRRVPALCSDQKTLDERKAEGKKTSISKWNAWRTKNFNNYFEYDNAGTAPRPQGNPQARWYHVEKEFIEIMLEKMIKNTDTALSGKDWQKLAKKHNKMFKRTKITVAERLFNGKAATKSEIIGERSVASLRSHFSKDEGLKELQLQLIKKYDLDHYEGHTTDKDSDSGSDEPVQDANLERGSNNEMDDQRPAAQSTVGVPVASTW